jgi:predicted methyltransferase
MVDVYHEFDFPYEMLLEISKSLKPGGRIAFVEYRKEDPTVPIKEVHKMSEAQVKKEANLPEFGLQFKETIRKLPRQHVIVFERPAADAANSK